MAPGIPWTPQEVELLHFAHEHGIAVRAVAELLERSRYSVHRKNQELGLVGNRRHVQASGDWTLDKVLETHGGAAVARFTVAMQSRGLHPLEELPDDDDLCARVGCYQPRHGRPREFYGLCLEHHTEFFGAP